MNCTTSFKQEYAVNTNSSLHLVILKLPIFTNIFVQQGTQKYKCALIFVASACITLLRIPVFLVVNGNTIEFVMIVLEI